MTGGLTGVGEAVGRSMWAELARMEAPCKPGQSRVYHVLPARDKFSTVLRDKVRRRLSPGLRLVYTWFTPAGPQQVLDGPERESEAVVTPGLRLVYTWFTPGLHLVYTWFSTVRRESRRWRSICTWLTSGLRQVHS